MIDHDHLEAGGTKTREVLFDDGAGGDGLTVGSLPSGAGEGALDVDGEEPEDQDHQEPSDEHPAEVGGGPGAESGKRAGRPHLDPVSVCLTATPRLGRRVQILGVGRVCRRS